MGHVTLVMAAYLLKVHFDFVWQEDLILLTKLDFLQSFFIVQ